MENQRWMIAAFMQHLEEAKQDPATNTELLSTVKTLLGQAYGIDLQNPATRLRYPTDGLSLPDVFIAGRKAILGNEAASSAGNDNTETKGEDDVAFEKFVKRLKRTTNFFGDTEEGSEEYVRRLERARTKFDERRKEKKPETKSTVSQDKSVPQAGVCDEVKMEADSIKEQGNAHLKAKEFDKAVECYTKCIELDGNNAIYYGNRAAAKMHLKEFAAAVDDCKMAISIDTTYARAHERLASAYRSLGMDDLELEVLQNAVQVHPDNAQLARLLTEAQNKKSTTTAEPASAGGFPGFPGLGADGAMPSPEQMANMAQGMGLNVSPELVQNFMSNPMMQQGLQSMMKNPEAMQAVQAMMNNPDAAKAAQEQLKTMMGGDKPDGNNE